MSHPSSFNQINPDRATAICTNDQAAQLAGYDHQRVLVSGREGILLTQEWLPLKNHVGPFILTVVFHNIESYSPAPAEIQSLVGRLNFQVHGQPR